MGAKRSTSEKIALAVLGGFLLCGGAAANPIYQIDFTGTITSGQVTDFRSVHQHFFNGPVLPQGGIPSSWSTVNPSGNGIFNFAELAQDPTMPGPAQHFGILTDYGVNGNFTFDSVSGAFVTPEPGTLLPTAALLLVLGAAVFSKSRS